MFAHLIPLVEKLAGHRVLCVGDVMLDRYVYGQVERISPVDRKVGHGDVVELGETHFSVIDTGGHTLGHITYFDADDQIAFVGDTLFALGCGRLFEGTAEQMWASLSRLAALPGVSSLAK